jgi:hypothetical protein
MVKIKSDLSRVEHEAKNAMEAQNLNVEDDDEGKFKEIKNTGWAKIILFDKKKLLIESIFFDIKIGIFVNSYRV